jgi:hypothetical protein
MAATATPDSGTKDKNYDLITVTQLCLEHVWRLDQYADDAEREGDQELAKLFRNRSTAARARTSARSCSGGGSANSPRKRSAPVSQGRTKRFAKPVAVSSTSSDRPFDLGVAPSS